METKDYRLGDVVEVVDTLHATAPVVENDTQYKMIRTANVRDGHLLTDTMKCVTEETYDKWTRRGTLEVGDVILTREAPMGEVGIIKRNDVRYFLGQRTLRLRPVSDVLDNEFLYYYLQGSYMQQQIGFNEGTGATVSNIRIPILLSMRMKLPALNLQRQMVQVLDAVDSKIELNQQINKNLLKLIDGMFNRVYLGSELVKNASRVKLSSIIRTKSGTFNPKKTSEVFVNHFSMPAFDAARFPVVNTASDIKSNKNVVEPFSILVSKMNPDVKRVWLPNTSKELLNVASTEFLTFNADVPEMQAFVYAVVNDKRYQKYLESNATGSTNSRQRVLPRVAYSYEIPYVKEVAQQFGFQIVDIMDMIKLNKEQNQHLIRLRNVLLPKLLAGDIDLSNIKTVMNNA